MESLRIPECSIVSVDDIFVLKNLQEEMVKEIMFTYVAINKDCDFSSIREDRIEDLIVDEFVKYQMKPELLAEYKSAINDMNTMVLEEK